MLRAQRTEQGFGEEAARDVVALNVAAHRLENLIHDRRLVVASQKGVAPQGQTPVYSLVGGAREAELEAARSSLATGTVLRGDVYPNPASRFDFGL